ncbi:hypothetical protein BH09PAT1_BH09PAT1_5740 [soil metagenome]
MKAVHETFFTAVGCMDGRVQDLVARYGREKFAVMYGDAITDAGLVGLLAQRASDKDFMESFLKRLFISIDQHQSRGIVLHAHENCAGNPVSNDLQKEQVRCTVELISSLVTPTSVVGIFIYRDQKNQGKWSIEAVH